MKFRDIPKPRLTFGLGLLSTLTGTAGAFGGLFACVSSLPAQVGLLAGLGAGMASFMGGLCLGVAVPMAAVYFAKCALWQCRDMATKLDRLAPEAPVNGMEMPRPIRVSAPMIGYIAAMRDVAREFQSNAAPAGDSMALQGKVVVTAPLRFKGDSL